METYNIKITSFEGPMDLLIFLIKKNKLDIYNIPITEITNQYLTYLDDMREFNIEIASEFIVFASTLLLIKSRMLLPRPSKDISFLIEEDPRQELVEKILEYKHFKKIGTFLEELFNNQKLCVTRKPMALPNEQRLCMHLSPSYLIDAFNILSSVKNDLLVPEEIISHEKYTIESQSLKIINFLKINNGVFSFKEFFYKLSKGEFIASFLAILELIKANMIIATQPTTYSDIIISLKENKDFGDVNVIL